MKFGDQQEKELRELVCCKYEAIEYVMVQWLLLLAMLSQLW